MYFCSRLGVFYEKDVLNVSLSLFLLDFQAGAILKNKTSRLGTTRHSGLNDDKTLYQHLFKNILLIWALKKNPVSGPPILD